MGPQAALHRTQVVLGLRGHCQGRRASVHSSYSDLFRECKHTPGRCMRHLTYRSSNPDCTLQGDRISPVSQTRRLKSRVKSLLRSRPGHT